MPFADSTSMRRLPSLIESFSSQLYVLNTVHLSYHFFRHNTFFNTCFILLLNCGGPSWDQMRGATTQSRIKGIFYSSMTNEKYFQCSERDGAPDADITMMSRVARS